MTEQTEVLNVLMTEAHEQHTRPRAVAAYVVAELRRLEGSGSMWVSDLLAKWQVDGAMDRCSSWRASQRKAGRTKRGKPAEVSAWAGVPTRADDGTVEHQVLPLAGITLEQARAALARMSKHRNTLSATISVYERAVALMESDPSVSFDAAVEAAA